MATHESKRIALENVKHPGDIREVDAEMCHAMKRAFLKILPATSLGLTPAEIQQRLPVDLPADLFPGGAKAGWWMKAVELDLEAKGLITREKTKPLIYARHDVSEFRDIDGGRSTESVEI